METLKYELRSRPGVTVDVPAECAGKAEEMVDIATDQLRFVSAVFTEPYFRNLGVLAKAIDLVRATPGTREALRLQDEVYLRAVIYGNQDKTSGPEKEEAVKIERDLVRVVRELETGQVEE